MHYMGSKKNHAHEILAITLANRKPGQWYVEPFVGGGNIINKVPHEQGPRRAGDMNQYMLSALDAVGNHGWVPPEHISEKQYLAIKNDRMRHPFVPWVAAELGVPEKFWKALVGVVGTGSSFGSKWFDTYTGTNTPQKWIDARKAAISDAPGLRGVEFVWSSFDDLDIPEGALVYCDPPYRSTTGYLKEAHLEAPSGEREAYKWDAVKFWRWADALVDRGHLVYVSEYLGPPGSAYDAPLTREHAQLLDAIKRLPADPTIGWSRDDDPYGDEPVDEHAETRRNMGEELRRHEADRVKRAEVLAEQRWPSIWQKAASVNLNAISGGAKTEFENLFHRKP